jgi:hypothetical protein
LAIFVRLLNNVQMDWKAQLVSSDFVGDGQPLTQDGVAAVCDELSVSPATLWSVLSVETSGCGFLPDRRPRLLFERHTFSRLTHGLYDQSNSDISNPSPGGYGEPGDNQYVRIESAIHLNHDAALQSASWGIGQIMGENFAATGCSDVSSMIAQMCNGESAQLKCVSEFIRSMGLDSFLKAQDWTSFAQHYNGPQYSINRYDTKLAQSYDHYKSGPLPDLDVRAAQLLLTYGGYNVGPVDGVLGAHTMAALRAFQTKNGLRATGQTDGATMETLSATIPSN